MRKLTRLVKVGDVFIGADSQISVQSMTTAQTSDIKSVVNQIIELEKVGCQISRSAINSTDDAKAIKTIKEHINIPFVADIQFDYKLALQAVEYGCDCLRINPGNIGDRDKVIEVVNQCKKFNVPIRIGVNSGSISKEILKKYNGVNIDSLVYSAIEQVELLEQMNFKDIIISIKSSDVNTMIDANRKLSGLCDYPLHLGVTEAGPFFQASIKSAVGIGSLLKDGIGDTIRVSITGNPLEEIRVGKAILKSLNLTGDGVDIVSCPTCSRTTVDLNSIVNEVEKRLKEIDYNEKVAIMGCPVNGPGEAKEVNYGIACAKGYGYLFKKGRTIKKVNENQIVDVLIETIKSEMRNEI